MRARAHFSIRPVDQGWGRDAVLPGAARTRDVRSHGLRRGRPIASRKGCIMSAVNAEKGLANKDRVLVGVLVACGLAVLACFLYLGYSNYDLNGHWRICRYALMGIDPFPLIGQKPAVPHIGRIVAGFSTAPWSLMLGAVLYGAFLPLELAKVYVLLLHVVVYAALVAVVVRTARTTRALTRTDCKVAAALVLVHFSLMYSVRYGNTGAILCMMLLICVLVVGEHPWAAGVLVALAMTKPQMAAPICLVMLLNGHVRTIVLAAVIDLASWALASAATGTGFMDLLREMGTYGVMMPKQYLGLLSVARYAGVPVGVVLGLNVVVGLGFTLLMWARIKRSSCRFRSYLSYVPAFAASVVWIYKNGTDYLILCGCAFVLYYLYAHYERVRGPELMALAGMAYLEIGRVITSVLLALFKENAPARDLSKGLDGLLVLLITAYGISRWLALSSAGQPDQR